MGDGINDRLGYLFFWQDREGVIVDSNMKDLLRLYENTLSTQGVVRAEYVPGVELTRVNRLAHARWEIDQLLQGHDSRADDPTYALARFSFIQGILWCEQVFPVQALREQVRPIYAG